MPPHRYPLKALTRGSYLLLTTCYVTTYYLLLLTMSLRDPKAANVLFAVELQRRIDEARLYS